MTEDVCGLLQHSTRAIAMASDTESLNRSFHNYADDFSPHWGTSSSHLLHVAGMLAISLILLAALMLSSTRNSIPGGAEAEDAPPEARVCRTSEVQRKQESAKTAEASFRNDIQGFRALAVLCVFIYHIKAAWLPGGFTGVDMFFVVSGYVVTLQLLKSADRPSADEPFLPTFVARRGKRLVPILIVVILSTATYFVLTTPLSAIRFSISDMLKLATAGLFGWVNNWQLLQGQSYFGSGGIKLSPFFHLWSLGVEEQFYMLLGLLLFITGLGVCRRHGAAEPASENSDKIRRRLFPVILVTIGLSLCLSAYFSQKSLATSYGFYFVFARFWELASGVALALRSDEIATVLAYSEACLRILDILAVFLLATSLACTNENGFLWQPNGQQPLFPWPFALSPVLGTLCYLAAGLGRERWNLNGLLSSRGAVYVGDLSYSIYLWHVPVLTVMTGHEASAAAKSSVGLLLVLFLSVTGFHLVEQPCRKVRLTSGRALSMALLSLISAAALLNLMHYFRSVALLETWKSDMPSEFAGLYASHGCSCSAVDEGLFHSGPSIEAHEADNLPACLYPTPYVGVDHDHWTPTRCGWEDGSWKTRSPMPCLHPNDGIRHQGQPAIYVLGDSHSFVMLPAIVAATSRPVFVLSWGAARIRDIEVDFEKVVKANDVVIFVRHYHDSYCSRSHLEDAERLHNITSRNGAKMVIWGDNPSLTSHPQTMLGHRRAASDCVISKAEIVEQYSKCTAISTNLSQTYDDVYFFDPLPLLCNEEKCDQFVPGAAAAAFMDRNHLSVTGSLYIAPFLCSWFRQNGLAY